ncbi:MULTISPECIES: cobalt-precorrin-7 (C(5))-methyltransferase [unclassified Streptococcus]|uniref:cobalt-precorrin-7 (C(5))-methyltransferase n=1 Tax=unclassified Streptococcus TaxID=2608887 RepID=UPI0010726AFA|nr:MULTISPECIES: cobalt-precorrin-7 (C(5))-methyltransferase [unclassified Streptococcus]MBF0805581.1 cobalt-precorrin-7 (C(5))-methyltransferase [Streptococcus sp. 19428wA2_WM07]TFU28949.1 cobalt-precorrin-7 (C(5))-methyltransferase [Streptococcus sp. WM07]
MVMIRVVGIGPGDLHYGLLGQEAWFQEADLILGSQRHLDTLPQNFRQKGQVAPKKLADLKAYLHQQPEGRRIVFLVSGDPLVYGLGKWLTENFPGQVLLEPGISSMQYLASRLALPMNDAYLSSSHAKQPNFDFLLSLPKVFLVTDQQLGPYQIAQEVVKRGLRKTVVIGENLSYPDEKVSISSAEQVEDRPYKMNVVVIIDEGFAFFTNKSTND